MARRFQLVDVFSPEAFKGNPVAVILDSEGLSTEQMQAITRWFNLSETTFLIAPSRPGADYGVRIFTLDRELPFAGHPTLGSCHAWLTAGGRPASPDLVVQDCGVGAVPIRRDSRRLAFAAPPQQRSGAVEAAKLDEVLSFLNLRHDQITDSRWIDNGPGWLGIMMPSAQAVLAVAAARSWPTRMEVGLVGPHPAGEDIAWEIRALFSDQTGAIREDPVTGSLNASVAQWLFESGRASGRYVAAQGTAIGFAGRIHVEKDASGAVWIGGATQTIVSGEMPF